MIGNPFSIFTIVLIVFSTSILANFQMFSSEYILWDKTVIEYILAIVVLVIVILFISGFQKPRNGGSRKNHPSGYHGVYSHDSQSPDTEVYFPVLKDFSSVMPMNKREDRKKTETYQPQR
jgi:hypothetical protein